MVQNHGQGVIYHDKFKDEDRAVVFFNVQTGGLYNKSDVLQIGLRCGKKKFDTYIRPSKPIPAEVTKVNGLSSVGRTLYKDGQEVPTMSLSKSVKEIVTFFEDLDSPALLVAHQADFHVRRLKRLLYICRKFQKTENFIDGSADTLTIFRRKFKTRKEQGQLTLERLSESELQLCILKKYDAEYNCFLLEQLCRKNVEYHELVGILKDW